MKCLNCGGSLSYRKCRKILTIGDIDENGNLLPGTESGKTECRVHCYSCMFDAEYGIAKRCCSNCDSMAGETDKYCIYVHSPLNEDVFPLVPALVIENPYEHVCDKWCNGEWEAKI